MDIYTTVLLFALAGLVALDYLAPARRFPRMRAWRLRGLAYFALYLVVSTFLPFVWDEWLGEHRLIDATSLGLAGAAVGFLAYESVLYVWHRALHEVPLLWRWFHQMHHSAERVDVFGAFLFSPLDMIGFTFITSFSLVMLVGISAEAAAIAVVAITLLGVVQHANIRTPKWLGYLIQRPEGHAVHHQRGVHNYNYSDISLIDMLFGTWRNPATWNGEAGFYDGGSERVGDMLLGREISHTIPVRTRSTSPFEPNASASAPSQGNSPRSGARRRESAAVH